MDANEIVRALRCCADKTERLEECHTGQPDCPYGETIIDCTERMNRDAADLIESLQTENNSLAANGGRYMAIADERYEMYEKAIKRAEEAEQRLVEISKNYARWAHEYEDKLAASQRREKAAIERLNAKSGGGG